MAEYTKTKPSGSQYAAGVLSKQADKVLKSWKFARDSFENAREESEKAVRYLNNAQLFRILALHFQMNHEKTSSFLILYLPA